MVSGYINPRIRTSSNTSDTVFSAATVDDYEVEPERMSDGALLAWKTIIIRSALANSVCSAGSMAGGMPGRRWSDGHALDHARRYCTACLAAA